MARVKTITLVEPVVWHDKRLTEIKLKEPTGRHYADLGEPRVLVRNSDGAAYFVETTEVIARYLDHCLDVDGGSAVLQLLSLTDAIKLREALLDFFISARASSTSKSATA